MIDWIILDPNVSIWIPGTCEDVHLHSQRDSADGIKHHDIGNCCELSKWPLNFITGVFIRERESFNPRIRVPESYSTKKAKQ